MQEEIVENNFSIKVKRFLLHTYYSVLVISGFLFLGAINEAAKISGGIEISKKYDVNLYHAAGLVFSPIVAIGRDISIINEYKYKQEADGKISAFMYSITNNTSHYIANGIAAFIDATTMVTPVTFRYHKVFTSK